MTVKPDEVDTARQIIALASANCPESPGAYLLGFTVAHLQSLGWTLDQIQETVAEAFNTSWAEARAYAELLNSKEVPS